MSLLDAFPGSTNPSIVNTVTPSPSSVSSYPYAPPNTPIGSEAPPPTPTTEMERSGPWYDIPLEDELATEEALEASEEAAVTGEEAALAAEAPEAIFDWPVMAITGVFLAASLAALGYTIAETVKLQQAINELPKDSYIPPLPPPGTIDVKRPVKLPTIAPGYSSNFYYTENYRLHRRRLYYA